jgi:hypothetical protein
VKILFVLRAAGFFPYHQTTVDHLLARGHDVTLLFETRPGRPDDRAFEAWLAARGNRVVVGDAVKRRGWWRHVLFAAREARSYASYCQRGPEVVFYRERWRRYLPWWLERVVEHFRWADALFHRPVMQKLLAEVERLTPASRTIVAALGRDRPDCVVASPINLLHDEEVEYVKAARTLGIPSVVPVMSWDNLTTKGLLHVEPDFVLAWHAGHQQEAEEIHGVGAGHVVVTGSPFFDKWFSFERRISSRTATCRRIGLSPDAPYLLYLGSSANIARDESWLVLAVVRALREAPDPKLRRLQVVFKPHPGGSLRNVRALPRLDKAGILVWPRERGRPDTADEVHGFRDMMHHAAIVVGVNTTGMVDAILCDRPCLALTVKRYRSTQTDTTHFRRMLESNAFLVGRSVRNATTLISRTLAGDDPTAVARRRFAAIYARPRGVGAEAGEAAAIAIELACSRLSADAITARIERELGSRPLPGPVLVESDPDEAIPVVQ